MRGTLEWVLGLTSFAAGAVDVTSFAKLGGVLASAMTGNVALLGLYIGRGSAASAMGSLVALIAFILGTAAGVLVVRGREQRRALLLLLAAEQVLLLGGAILWLFTGQPHDGLNDDAVIALLANAMGLQIILGRQLNLAGIPTVVFTSTLTNIVTGVTEAFARKTFLVPADLRRQCTALLLYFFGAVVAGVLVYAGTPATMFLPAAVVAAALAALHWPA